VSNLTTPIHCPSPSLPFPPPYYSPNLSLHRSVVGAVALAFASVVAVFVVLSGRELAKIAWIAALLRGRRRHHAGPHAYPLPRTGGSDDRGEDAVDISGTGVSDAESSHIGSSGDGHANRRAVLERVIEYAGLRYDYRVKLGIAFTGLRWKASTFFAPSSASWPPLAPPAHSFL